MKRLFLLRHAKAGFATSDHARPLAKRGKRDAFWLGQYLKKSNLLPDYVLCSSAKRAKESLSQLSDGAGISVPTHFYKDLYLASAEHMTRKIQSLDININAPMIIGHNPGLSMLFHNLAKNPPKDDRSLKYPTCMVSILDFDIDNWSDLKTNGGQLVACIIPSDRIGQ
ncbi:MAG: phosphoglycerate mutase [Alphaproteobacteria bacterium]|nr:MAG: phosphoglycerate mutase [Alphaproteobacteria bacterium]